MSQRLSSPMPSFSPGIMMMHPQRVTTRLALWTLLPLLLLASSFPSPLTIPTNGAEWLALDWSVVEVSIGNPPQLVRLIPSTSTSEVLVLDPGSCPNTNPPCDPRGGSYSPVLSSSYSRGDRNAIFDLAPPGLYPESANESINYGTDTILIQTTDGSGTIGITDIAIGSALQTTAMQQVGALQVGLLGLGPRSVNIHIGGNSSYSSFPGLVMKLYNQGLVPSQSWAYTAGAYNKGKGVPADLILGGYNSAFTTAQGNTTFTLDANMDTVLTLTSLTVAATGNAAWGSGSQSLLTADTGGSILARIDSTTPYLWLPQQICKQFETYLGLVWDPTVEMYLLGSDDSSNNDPPADKTLQSVRDDMKKLNVSFTFTLSNSDSPDDKAKAVNIVLSYDSFDLRIPYSSLAVLANGTSSTFANDTNSNRIMRYFPLKRASSEAQYTLGRAFLQEAYIITNYHQHTFQVYQRPFHNLDRVVTPIWPNGINPYASPPKKGFGVKQIIGIAVGISLASLLVCIVLGSYCWRRRQRRRDQQEENRGNVFTRPPRSWHSMSSSVPLQEYYNHEQNWDQKPIEMDSTCAPIELDGESNRKPEMEGDTPEEPLHELPGGTLIISQIIKRPDPVVRRTPNYDVDVKPSALEHHT